MNEQIWSWIVTLVGISGFFITSNKIWWGWYVNLGCQVLWITYALVSHQPAFLISAGLYSVVFGRAAIKWTREHFNADAVDRAAMLKASIMTTNEAREKGYMDPISMEFKKQARIIHEGPEFDPDVMRQYPDHEHLIVKNYNPPPMSVDQQPHMTKTQERAAVLDFIDDFDIYRNRIALPGVSLTEAAENLNTRLKQGLYSGRPHKHLLKIHTTKDYVLWYHCDCGAAFKVDKFVFRQLIAGVRALPVRSSWEGLWWHQTGYGDYE